MAASCPTSMPQGARTVTVAPVSGKEGTSPYTLEWYADGVEKTISPVWDSVNKRWTFSYAFSETLAKHTYKSKVTDACGAVSENSCSITLGKEEEKAAGMGALAGVGLALLGIGAAYLLLKVKK